MAKSSAGHALKTPGVHHAQLCRKSLSYTSKLKLKHRWWKYRHFQIYTVLTAELQSFSSEAYTQYKNLLQDGNTCFLSLLTMESNVKIHGHCNYGCNGSLRRKTTHRLLAYILTVLLIVLSCGNSLSWHMIAGMDELLYFFLRWKC